jgi:hypothetical protein
MKADVPAPVNTTRSAGFASSGARNPSRFECWALTTVRPQLQVRLLRDLAHRKPRQTRQPSAGSRPFEQAVDPGVGSHARRTVAALAMLSCSASTEARLARPDGGVLQRQALTTSVNGGGRRRLAAASTPAVCLMRPVADAITEAVDRSGRAAVVVIRATAAGLRAWPTAARSPPAPPREFAVDRIERPASRERRRRSTLRIAK